MKPPRPPHRLSTPTTTTGSPFLSDTDSNHHYSRRWPDPMTRDVNSPPTYRSQADTIALEDPFTPPRVEIHIFIAKDQPNLCHLDPHWKSRSPSPTCLCRSPEC
ncbi:hypothetical protein TIFTF001_016058 [Ficus carica]|uniref:Uncharacterized protein n=1 Tax=Ficus carica TaxID=3494 RepID=A0AA88D9I9_FICCA|nr:hypothetical protein TIFTF001_016058 [Ficus carica]